MLKLKSVRVKVVKILPPVLVKWVRMIKGTHNITNKIVFQGDYLNWQQAVRNSRGYGDQSILNATKDALLKVKHGEAVYERDSVLYDEIQYSWPLLASLLKVASNSQGSLHLVDFGGSLGTTYYQNRHFMNGLQSLKWHVVDQKHVVACGKEYFQDDYLKFHDTLEEACKANDINCVLLSGVLQYLENPYEQLNTIFSRQFEYVIIDRTSFIQGVTDRISLQVVPPCIYEASYPCRFFNEDAFLSVIKMKYDLIASFNSYADHSTTAEDGKKLYWKGFFFKLK